MAIGTADGKYYEDEAAHYFEQFGDTFEGKTAREHDFSAIKQVGKDMQTMQIPLPKESDPGSENVIDRRAPIYNRQFYPTGTGVFQEMRTIDELHKQPVASIPILRHGKTAENEKDIAHGWSDEPLIPEGRKEVEKAADELIADAARKIPYRPYGYPHPSDVMPNDYKGELNIKPWELYQQFLKERKPGDNLQDWLNKNHPELPPHEVDDLGQFSGNLPKLIAHSDLKRAAESAKIVADKTGAETLSLPELRTWDIGNFAGKKCGECEKQLQPYVDNPDKRVPGGESFNDFRRRVTEGFHKAMSAGADMLVTHNKTERLIDAMEKSDKPHEVFTHDGGPEPGKMRDIKLAGDVVPGPGFGGLNWKQVLPAGARGRASINRQIDQGRVPELSNVETSMRRGSPLTDEQKYENAVTLQQRGRGGSKDPMGKILSFEQEPEFKE